MLNKKVEPQYSGMQSLEWDFGTSFLSHQKSGIYLIISDVDIFVLCEVTSFNELHWVCENLVQVCIIHWRRLSSKRYSRFWITEITIEK